MKKIIILAGICYPNPSATGSYALKIANILKRDYEVSIIGLGERAEELDGVEINGINYYIISHRLFSISISIPNVPKSNSQTRFAKSIRKFSLMLASIWLRSCRSLMARLSNAGPVFWFRKKAKFVLENICSQAEIACIISVCSPFSAHLAAIDFKRKYPGTRWVTYTVDPYSATDRKTKQSLLTEFICFRKRRIEKKVYASSSFNLVSEEVYSEYQRLLSKTNVPFVAMPYVIKPDSKVSFKSSDKDSIILLYAGTFYRKFRNPEYLYRTFIEAAAIEKMELHLYEKGDCEDLTKKYIRMSNGKIKKFDLVSTEEINRVMQAVNILVSVGNSLDSYKPSKIFSYIATGQPIVHFCKKGHRETILEAYPLALQIEEDEQGLVGNACKLVEFCNKNKTNRLTPEEITKLYPHYSEENFAALIFKAILQPE